MHTALIVVGAYLLGSISFAVVLSRMFALPDPHSYGSGNPGATNVLRTGNKAAALLTLVVDAVKGFAAVVIAYHLGISWRCVTRDRRCRARRFPRTSVSDLPSLQGRQGGSDGGRRCLRSV